MNIATALMYSLTFPNHLCSITSKVAQPGRVVGELNNTIALNVAAPNTQHSSAHRKRLTLNIAVLNTHPSSVHRKRLTTDNLAERTERA